MQMELGSFLQICLSCNIIKLNHWCVIQRNWVESWWTWYLNIWVAKTLFIRDFSFHIHIYFEINPSQINFAQISVGCHVVFFSTDMKCCYQSKYLNNARRIFLKRNKEIWKGTSLLNAWFVNEKGFVLFFRPFCTFQTQ